MYRWIANQGSISKIKKAKEDLNTTSVILKGNFKP
jgi:hypothetical protein